MLKNDSERIDRITSAVDRLLRGRIPPPIDLGGQEDDEILQLSTFLNRLIEQEKEAAQVALKLSKGDLDTQINCRTPAAHSLKNLQASLKHLTWQTQQIAKGDFTQRTNFLGDFSESFNWMVTRLESYRREMQKEITDRKEAQAYAEKASRAKSDFLASMSHELRTPLNHIIGFTELVLDKHFGELNEIQAEYLQDVLDSSHHLLSLVNDILDLSKIEAGKLELALKEVNPKVLIEQSMLMVKEKTLMHGIELSVEIGDIPHSIQADERKLKQIIYNLLSNAVKFTPAGGRIQVRAREIDHDLTPQLPGTTGRRIEVSVIDTGAGIQAEDLERIFKPFEQLDNSEGAKDLGTGLGLSLARKLVELHGGEICAESDGAGKGSTFRFVIPVP